MQRMIAYCGLVCSNCPTFLATQADDDARENAAAFYHERYGFNLPPKDINCDGCLSDTGKLMVYCQSCDIRKCCQEKSLNNCAVCSEEPCEKLNKFHEFSTEAKTPFPFVLAMSIKPLMIFTPSGSCRSIKSFPIMAELAPLETFIPLKS